MSRTAVGNGSCKRTDRRSDQKATPVVYFAAIYRPHEDRPIIKIGYSSDSDNRFATHIRDWAKCDATFKPICMVRGSKSDEGSTQAYFNKRGYGLPNQDELFRSHDDHDELIDYIRWLRDQFYVWVPDDDECDPIESLEAMSSSFWLPSKGRRKGPMPTLYPDEFGLQLASRKTMGDDFYTPPKITAAARRAMGGIDTDPASHPVANKEVKAATIYGLHEDGLTNDWFGKVWLNPPFGTWKPWAEKAMSEWLSGRLEAMCALCSTRATTAKYLRNIARGCNAVCIFHGRLDFWGPRASKADEGHVVWYFGGDTEAFRREFSKLGYVFINPDVVVSAECSDDDESDDAACATVVATD